VRTSNGSLARGELSIALGFGAAADAFRLEKVKEEVAERGECDWVLETFGEEKSTSRIYVLNCGHMSV